MLLISPTKTLFHAEYTESCQPSYGGNVFSDQIEPSTGEQDCQVMMVMMMQYQNIQHRIPYGYTTPNKQINIADDSSEQLSECGETKLQTNRRGAMSRGNKNYF